ncbi:type II secretion system protein [bacterium]|jgi:hypothetical protein|nr:type II secretion system protein [bacterium]
MNLKVRKNLLRMIFSKKRAKQSGFMLAEVVIVLLLVGFVFSSLLVLEGTIINSVRVSREALETLAILENYSNKIMPFLSGNVLHRDEKIKKVLTVKSNEQSLSKEILQYKDKKDSTSQFIRQYDGLDCGVLNLAIHSGVETLKKHVQLFFYNPSKEGEEK